MIDALTALLTIQKVDLKIRTFEERIKSLSKQRQQVEETLADQQASHQKKVDSFNELRKRSQELNAEADSLDEQIRHYQKQLDDGLISFKEMESFREQIEKNRIKMEAAEEEGILLLDEVESESAKLKEHESSFAQWKSRIDEELQEIDEDIAVVQEKIAKAQADRTQRLESVEVAYLEKYELLLKSVENPIASISDGSCNGCNITLSTSTLERARAADGMVTCENCNRLIYM